MELEFDGVSHCVKEVDGVGFAGDGEWLVRQLKLTGDDSQNGGCL